MSKISNAKRFLTDKDYRFYILSFHGFYDKMPDGEYVKRIYRAVFGKEPDLEDPKTFSEKLQWLKLNHRRAEHTMMADKFAVREYIEKKLGQEYLIPLLGVWDDPEQIDFDALPDQFVLKCNHNSGLGMYICKDKSKMNVKKVKKELKKGMAQDYYLTAREWPYKNIKRKIICEKFMTDGSDEPIKDYKFFCFNGEPKIMYVSNDLSSSPTTDFFDMDFNRLDLRMKDPNSDIAPEKPALFEEMKRCARILCQGHPFLRVDMYCVNGRIYFGELTFFHNSGFVKAYPEAWNYTLGEWIDLSVLSK